MMAKIPEELFERLMAAGVRGIAPLDVEIGGQALPTLSR
jgi:hypothetical protein